MDDLRTLGDVFAKSGFFKDAGDVSKAIVKIIAGAEIGFGPVASMTGIYLVQGRVTLSANLMGAAIKRSGRYNYRITQHTDSICEIEFLENGQPIGKSSFTIEEAKRAGLLSNPTWTKYPRNMLFARAMSNGAKWHCGDIFGGPIYTPDEMGVEVDGDTGEVVVTPAKVLPMQSPESDAVVILITTAQINEIRQLAKERGIDVDQQLSDWEKGKLETQSRSAAEKLIEWLRAKPVETPATTEQVAHIGELWKLLLDLKVYPDWQSIEDELIGIYGKSKRSSLSHKEAEQYLALLAEKRRDAESRIPTSAPTGAAQGNNRSDHLRREAKASVAESATQEQFMAMQGLESALIALGVWNDKGASRMWLRGATGAMSYLGLNAAQAETVIHSMERMKSDAEDKKRLAETVNDEVGF